MEPFAEFVDVVGARLRYRWLPANAGPVLVFENGWGASLEQWTWVERELKGSASLLFYSHAGIGGSDISAAQTAARISTQFVALLDALALRQPVVLVGHSFGGLIAALHAAQQPSRVAALVQVDNTQEVDDPVLDQSMGLAKWFGALAIGCARLGIRDPLFGSASKTLPPEEGERLHALSFGSASSLRASLAELALIPEIRATIAAAPPSQPRLVISAGRFGETPGLLGRLLSPSPAEIARRLAHVQQLHRAQVGMPGSRWMTLPHAHGDLVFTAAGAADTAREALRFASGLIAKRPKSTAA